MRMASFCEPATICNAGLTHPKQILDFKAFALATKAWPRTAGPAVSRFMSAWLIT